MSIDAIVIDVKHGRVYKTKIDNYKDYYEHLGCDCFDVVMSEDRTLSAFVDDEGLLKSGNLVSDISALGIHTPLAGNIVLTGGVDAEGETLSIPSNYTVMQIYSKVRIVGEVR